MPNPDAPLWRWDAADIARAVRLGRVSAREAAESALARQAERLGARLHLLGEVADPSPLMARAAVLALTSDYEGVPAVLGEALAVGTPVVATASSPALSEIVRSPALGAIVPRDDPAALVAALGLIGSPVRARLLRLDGQRVGDLRSLQSSIEQFHTRRGSLPATLDDLAKDPDTFVVDAADPVTKQPYGYTRLDDRTYELRATFDLPSPTESEQPQWNRDEFFKHSDGEQRFTITVPEK